MGCAGGARRDPSVASRPRIVWRVAVASPGRSVVAWPRRWGVLQQRGHDGWVLVGCGMRA
ncbi:MAG TPA: hypothetical protein VKG45_08030 [Actinomycetes bacterium]|nr:hypothetical protein [Actinomycetes bacterium]